MRVRLRFTKQGKVRFTGHRDVARILERSLRRAGLPLAMTEGFSPRPKVHFGLALSTGYESLGEYLDVDLRPDDAADVQLPALPAQLTALLPPGLAVEAAAEVDRTRRLAPTGRDQLQLATRFRRCTRSATSPTGRAPCSPPRRRCPSLASARARPCTTTCGPPSCRLEVVDDHLEAELSTQPRGVRPAELLAAFEPARPDPITEGGRVCRTQQWITPPTARARTAARDVGHARGGACVMRRERHHDRTGHQRPRRRSNRGSRPREPSNQTATRAHPAAAPTPRATDAASRQTAPPPGLAGRQGPRPQRRNGRRNGEPRPTPRPGG